MKLRNSLYLQIFAALFLYFSGLAVLGFIAFNAKFGIGWEAIYNSPAGERVATIGEGVSSQLRASPKVNWDQILKNFQHMYGAKFYLFNAEGEELAGEQVTLPQSLKRRIIMPRPWFARIRHGALLREGFELEIGNKRFFIPGNHVRLHDFVIDAGRPPGEFPVRPGERPVMHNGEFLGPPGDGAPMQHGPPPGDFGMPPGPPPDGPPPDGPPGFDDHAPNSQVMHEGFPVGMRAPPPPMMPAHPRFMVHTTDPDRFWFVVRDVMPIDESQHPEPVAIIASPDNIWQSSLLFDFKFVLEAAAIALALSFLFWCPLVYSITRALSDLTKATEKIADGNFDTRLKNRRHDEIGRLANAVNIMAQRLEGFLSGQKRLLGDISHELFTPIARLQMAIELLDTHLPAQNKDLLNDIREEVTEMNNLVSELLAFSKAGVKGQSIELREVELRGLFANLLRRLDLASRVKVDVPEGIVALGDPMLLDRCFANILRNSVRYGSTNGSISVEGRRGLNGEVIVILDDEGPGVPEEAIQYIGEPFYRPETARARESGGAGLGLAIVKTCVQSCRGTVAFRNRASGGFEVEVRLLAGDSEAAMEDSKRKTTA
ncbi:MAG TPA: HAMP domain-containing sensor histidine kinase [Planktothrix sp.]